MDTEQLRYFVMSAEYGSLSAAAQALYTSQPHVSQVIRSLEREIGTALFERIRGGVRLTAAGEEMMFYAGNILRDTDSIHRIGSSFRGSGLKIAANPSSSLSSLTEDFIGMFGHEGFMMDYTECPTEDILSRVGSGSYDLGFLFVPVNKLAPFRRTLEDRGMEFTPFFTTGLVVNCGEKGPFADRESISPLELDGVRCIQSGEDYFSVEELLKDDEHFRKKGCSIIRAVRTNSDHLMMNALRNTDLCNIGIFWKMKDVSAGISAHPIEGFEECIFFGCIRSEKRTLTGAAEEFFEYIKKGSSL